MPSIGLLIVTEPLPHRWDGLVRFGREVDASGIDALWFADHLHWHQPTPDPLTAISLMAGATSIPMLGSLVLQLPMRHTPTIGKSFGFLNAVTGGRIILGVGVGEHRDEYELAGFGDRYARRGRLLDEAIVEIRAFWEPGARSAMAPSRPVPVWIGGRSGAARRRAATIGDAWIPHFCHIRWFRRHVPRFHEEARLSGRQADPHVGVTVLVHVDPVEPGNDPARWAGDLYRMAPSVFSPILVRGSQDEVVEQLLDFAEAGAEHIALLPASERPLEHVRAVLDGMPASGENRPFPRNPRRSRSGS